MNQIVVFLLQKYGKDISSHVEIKVDGMD